ncbi:MAG: L-rhamnose isomerase [Verrucomicrobiales bacterium]|jgi:L-rhamnose isomerase
MSRTRAATRHWNGKRRGAHFLQPDKSDAVQNIYQAANRDWIMRDCIIEIDDCFHDPVFHRTDGQEWPSYLFARRLGTEGTKEFDSWEKIFT